MTDKNNENLKLNDYDITINSIRQDKLFKGTIAVCVVYGILAIIILIAAIISENIRNLIFSKFLIFTMVFILGTIIIISILIYYIVKFKPVKIDLLNMYDNFSCPDYWKMEQLDDGAVKNAFDSNLQPDLFKYRCVMDNNTFNKLNIFTSNSSSPSDKNYKLTNLSEFTKQADGNLANSYKDPQDVNFNKNFEYGHLYKNINAYNTTSADDLKYYGKSNVASNIKTTLIEASLLMNNYEYDTNSKNYKNIGSNNLNINNNNTYITWDNRTSGANSNILSPDTNSAIIIKWNNIDLNYYHSILNPLSTTTRSNDKLYVYTKNTPSVLIGEITIIYNDEDIPISLSFMSKNNISKSVVSGTDYIIQTNISATENSAGATFNGPTVKIYNNNDRKPTLSSTDITSSNIPLVCDTIYPAFIASKEDLDKNGSQNALRCAYSKICGITWSDMSCD